MSRPAPVDVADELFLIRAAQERGWNHDRIMRTLRMPRTTYFRRCRQLANIMAGRPALKACMAS